MKSSGVMRKAFGWGGSMALVRMVCSFISIKITAVYLGPAGLALVAQFSNFVSLFQSMLGQGLVTGSTRLASERGDDLAYRRRVYSTALRIGLALTLLVGIVMLFAAPLVAQWLLTDRQYTWLIAASGLAIGAAIVTDLVFGLLGVTKEIGLIGVAVIVSTVAGLMVFAPFSYLWGIEGGLWGTFVVLLLSGVIAVVLMQRRSQNARVSDFLEGGFDRAICKRLFGFFPMLIVNGVLPPLALILVRDALASATNLDTAGLWQATWRLSEAYQAIIVSSISLYFMPHMGERINDPPRLRLQILRNFGAALAVTAGMAACIALLRSEIVHIIFNHRFDAVVDYLPLQLVGDVLKMGGWVFGMSLVALSRTSWFIGVTALNALLFVGITHLLAPQLGVHAALWAYVVAGVAQVAVGAFALRDVLRRRNEAPAVPVVEA